MDGCTSSTDFCSTTTCPCSVSAIHSENRSCSTSTTTRPRSVSSTDSEDVYEGYSDVSSEDTDEETEEIAGKTLEPYQFEPVEASDTDQSDYEEESSSDEELLGILPEDMSW